MTTTEPTTEKATRSDASTTTLRRPHRGLAAAGAIGIAGLGIGLTALIIGVMADPGTEAPSPHVPPVAELPFDASDPNALAGIDRRLYELAERRFDASDPNALTGIDRRLYELAE